MPSIYGTPTVYLALSVGAGREEKVKMFREETSLRGENLEDDTERIVGRKQILLYRSATQCVFGSNRQHPAPHTLPPLAEDLVSCGLVKAGNM